MKKKSFVIERKKALYSDDQTMAITFLDNIPKLELYKEMSYPDFTLWNQVQEDKHDWWIATGTFYKLKKSIGYFGCELDQFKVYVPKIARPIIFMLEGICFLVAPFLGYYFTGEMDWQEQPQEETVILSTSHEAEGQ